MTYSEETIKWIEDQYKILELYNSLLIPNKKLKLCFRGESRINENPFLPSLFRTKGLKYHFKDVYSETTAKFYYDFQNEKTTFDKLVKMQHFNIPTKLLDVTDDPYIALYFACSNNKKDDINNDGSLYAFYISNDGIVYPNNPISAITSVYYGDNNKQSLFEKKKSIELNREIKIESIYALVLEKLGHREDPNFTLRGAVYDAKNEINFNEDMFTACDLTGVFNVIPNYINPRIARQRSSFLIGGISEEDALLNTIFHYNDIRFLLDILKSKSFKNIDNDIIKSQKMDDKCKEYLIAYLNNFNDKNIFDFNQYLPAFTIETFREFYTDRIDNSKFYLEYLLFLYGLFGFEGKFSFYNNHIIQAKDKKSLIDYLENYKGITYGYLFPDLEHFGTEIRNRYNID